MDDLRKDLKISTLFDYYGGLLTDKQRDFTDLYYNEDLSLAEIAEHEDITRQGVRDSIKHAETKLLEYEKELRLAERSEKYYELNSAVAALAEEAQSALAYSKQAAAEKLSEIRRLTKKYKDLF